jgi:hypothetical protein
MFFQSGGQSMTIPLRLADQTAQPIRGAILSRHLLPTETLSASERRLEPSPELPFRVFAAFRAHPHINNVLTHIARARWGEVEQALNRIFDLSMTGDGLSPLEENIVELMVGERGITGKILKPYFQAALRAMLEPSSAERLIRHITALHLELEWKAQHPPPAPLPSPLKQEPNRGEQSK